MNLRVAVLAAVLLCACGGTSTPAPTVAPAPTPVPTSAATSQATLAPAPVTANPTAAPANTPAPTAVATLAATITPAAGIAKASGVTLTIDGSNTKASYHAHEQLVGRTLPSEAVGTTSNVSGQLVLTPDGKIIADQSQIEADLGGLKSDESRRDNFIKGETLQTGRYPMATFVPRDAPGLPSPLPVSGDATFQLEGDLTVHGVTRQVMWTVNAQFTPETVGGDATTTVNISDFGMTPPKAGPVLSIEDGLTLEIAFSAARSG